MTNEERAKIAVEKLKKEYPNAKCSLIYSTPLQLLIATRLSAQCTDARVNKVTPQLFLAFKTADDFAKVNPEELEKYVHSCGLYKTKSKDIINMCAKIVSCFNGNIPNNLKELTSLPGIGRKTANLFLSEIYGKPAVVTDTHFIRITKRLGFHDSKNPLKVEKIMTELLPKSESTAFCHRIVALGRSICTARSPKCNECCLQKICKYNSINHIAANL
jgi:endonuclease-3